MFLYAKCTAKTSQREPAKEKGRELLAWDEQLRMVGGSSQRETGGDS